MALLSLLRQLSYPDSNRIKQNQNLLCYHYTIGQYLLSVPFGIGCEVTANWAYYKKLEQFFVNGNGDSFRIRNERHISFTLYSMQELTSAIYGAGAFSFLSPCMVQE